MLQQYVDTSALRSPYRARVPDAERLARALAARISGEVRFDSGSRALYATDASNYRQVPIGVVLPKSEEDVIETVRLCREAGAPVLARGGGTSLCGQCCNVAVVLDFSKFMNRILELNANERFARVQPGVVLDRLRDAAEAHHLTFGPDPATHDHNTLGGMLGNNSCGPHSVMAGETVHNVIELEVLTYDGTRMTVGPTDDAQLRRIEAQGGRAAEIHARLQQLCGRHAAEIRRRYPRIPRRVSGYNLEALLPEHGFDVAKALVGSEGTCAVILSAKLRLVESPPARSLLVLGYPSVYEAGDHVPDVLAFHPIALEGMDDRLVADMKAVGLHPADVKLLPEGGGWLLVEFGGDTKDESDARARRAISALRGRPHPPSMKLFDDPAEEKLLWRVRESGLGATAHVPDKRITWEGWEDSAVPPGRLGEYLRKLRALFERYGYGCDLYGHFGQGCVHTRIDFDLETAAGIARYRAFLQDAAHLVVSCGGSISGEHGDGQSKAELLPIMYGEELMGAFREFKAIWDPAGRMNPGKVIDAFRPDENLRLGTSYNPPAVATRFGYPADEGDFARALLRCVGVGECRKHAGTMCPSYMVTGEERHSTRGRARLLFEMLRGETLKGGWREEAVKDALELCLSCKGCRGECPVNVDMATYKAEFLSHYYEGRLRPPAAYAFGLVDRWSRLGSRLPRVANTLMRSVAGRVVAGIAEQRVPPALAPQTFRRWASRQPPARGDAILLWADTFTNYYEPHVARAAYEVLASAGFSVQVPNRHLCCGRPLYEFGMVDSARRYLEEILERLGSEIDAGMPFVVLEPACASVFRGELTELLPHNERARRLRAQTLLFSELIEQRAPSLDLLTLGRRALLHGHCHQKAILGMDAETSLARRLGLHLEMPDTGCCGMAGSFGFEKEKYAVSIAAGERVLAPAVRACPQDALVIADGFSCRAQIRDLTGREPIHLAEAVRLALPGGRV